MLDQVLYIMWKYIFPIWKINAHSLVIYYIWEYKIIYHWTCGPLDRWQAVRWCLPLDRRLFDNIALHLTEGTVWTSPDCRSSPPWPLQCLTGQVPTINNKLIHTKNNKTFYLLYQILDILPEKYCISVG